jgi:hypothetical protein
VDDTVGDMVDRASIRVAKSLRITRASILLRPPGCRAFLLSPSFALKSYRLHYKSGLTLVHTRFVLMVGLVEGGYDDLLQLWALVAHEMVNSGELIA